MPCQVIFEDKVLRDPNHHKPIIPQSKKDQRTTLALPDLRFQEMRKH